MANRNPLTFSRQELYDLVWSKPVSEVAKEIGLSDVAIAKRCRQVQVPVPPRGYWARIAAGQTPKRTPLPKYRDNSGVARANRASVLRETEHAPSREPSAAADASSAETPVPPGPTITFHGTERIEEKTKTGAESSPGPEDPYRRALEARLSNLVVPADAPEGWADLEDPTVAPPGWPESLRTSARLPVISVHSDESMLRARRIATQLIHVITQLGWRFVAKTPEPVERPYYNRGYESYEDTERRSSHLLVEDERLFISITERRRRTERPLTPEEQRERRRNPTGYFYYPDRYSYHASGELTLHVNSSIGSGGFASFRGSKRRPLERRIADIVRCLLQGALDIKQRRKEAAEAAERQRQEELRKERIRKMREAHAHLIHRLEAQAGAWERAQRLRRYLRAARRTLAAGERIDVLLEGESVELLALGEAFANQLDPLHPAARTVPFFDKQDPYATGLSYESDETKLRMFMARALGGDWRHAPKRDAAEAKPEQSPGERLFSAESDLTRLLY